jgi:hypothetical protein
LWTCTHAPTRFNDMWTCCSMHCARDSGLIGLQVARPVNLVSPEPIRRGNQVEFVESTGVEIALSDRLADQSGQLG